MSLKDNKYIWAEPASAKAVFSVETAHIQSMNTLGRIMFDLALQVERIADSLEGRSAKPHINPPVIDLPGLLHECNGDKIEFVKAILSKMEQGAVFGSITPDKKQLLTTLNTPEYQKGPVLVVTVIEYMKYRDGGTIEYRDVHNRIYVVPAPIYRKPGIYSDTRQTTWVEAERLRNIELNIVQSFTTIDKDHPDYKGDLGS